MISMSFGELNFSKKLRGRKVTDDSSIPEKLTRRHCTARVAEVFDITGKLTPLTVTFKMDLHDLISRKLNWDDVLPDNLRALWVSHFKMIEEINSIRYRRAIIPEDAIDLDLETLDFGDASKSAACAAIYARFKRKNGAHSSQLVLSRSQLVPEEFSQPRAELHAAVLCTHTGEIVRKSFHKHHRKSFKFTDSQIVLHWISNEERPLKQWVRNRVLEIKRFTEPESWLYLYSKDMIADIGTRRGSKIQDVNNESFPTLSVKQITINSQEVAEMKKEMSYQDIKRCKVERVQM